MSEQPKSTIRGLLAEVTKDGRHLMAVQRELLQTEMKSEKKAAAETGGMFAVALGAAAMGGLFLLLTAAWGLVALGLDEWAAFGIVTLVLFLVAAIAGAVGKSRSKGVAGLPMAKAELARTKSALTGGSRPSTDLVPSPRRSPARIDQAS